METILKAKGSLQHVRHRQQMCSENSDGTLTNTARPNVFYNYKEDRLPHMQYLDTGQGYRRSQATGDQVAWCC